MLHLDVYPVYGRRKTGIGTGSGILPDFEYPFVDQIVRSDGINPISNPNEDTDKTDGEEIQSEWSGVAYPRIEYVTAHCFVQTLLRSPSFIGQSGCNDHMPAYSQQSSTLNYTNQYNIITLNEISDVIPCLNLMQNYNI